MQVALEAPVSFDNGGAPLWGLQGVLNIMASSLFCQAMRPIVATAGALYTMTHTHILTETPFQYRGVSGCLTS